MLEAAAKILNAKTLKIVCVGSEGGARVNALEKDVNLFARFRHPLVSHCLGAHEQGPTV